MKRLFTFLSLLLPLTVFGQSGQPWSALRETLVLSNSWIQAVAVPGVTNYKFTIGTLTSQIVAQVTLSGSATNAVTRGENLALTNATTFGVFYRVVGQSNMQFFTIKAGTNILIQRDGSNIVINATPGSGSSVAAPLGSVQFNSNGVMQGSAGMIYTNGYLLLASNLSVGGNQTNLGSIKFLPSNIILGTYGAQWGASNLNTGKKVFWVEDTTTDEEFRVGGHVIADGMFIGTNAQLTAIPGTGTNVGITAGGTLFRMTVTGGGESGSRIVAYEGDSLVNQALPVWPRSMDSNSVWFARSDVETNWGANGDTMQNIALTYPTQAHLNRPTNDTDEALFAVHGGFNDYPIGRTDSQIYGDTTNTWGQARADKYKVVAMPIVGHTNLSAMVLSNLTLFDYLVRVDVMLANTNNTAMYYDTVHPTPAGANNIARAVAAVVDGKPWMLVHTREETNSARPHLLDLILNPGGRYVSIGASSPRATLHIQPTNAGQNALIIASYDGTPRFQAGTYPGGDQYATLWGPVTANGTNYLLSANANATVLNAADSVTVNVGHVVKIYTDSTGVYIPMSVGTGDHVAIRADGFLMRTNIVGGGGTSTQFVTATFGTATVTNTISAQTFNVQTGNFAFINLTNFLGSNQVRLGMQQLTNVQLTSLAEGNSLFWNAANGQWTNAPGGSGSGSGSTQMVTAAIGTLTQTNSISFVVSNQANIGSWLLPAKTNYANAFYAMDGGTNRLGETIFDNNVNVTSNLTVGVLVGTGDFVAVNAAGKLLRTNLASSGFGSGHSNAIPFINGAGTSYTYYDTGTSLTNPGFGFNPQTVGGPQAGYGGLMVFANESMGLVTIGHPNPGADFSTFTTALVVSNRYNSAGNFKNDMVKIDAVMVGGGLQGDSTMTRWRVWQGTTSSNDVAEITIGGQMKLFGGTLYPTNVAASLPSAATLGAGGYWVGNSNGVLVSLYSLNGSSTTMKVLVP